MTAAALDTFMGLLRRARGSGWFNPWSEWVDGIDVGPAAPVQRSDYLFRYLNHRLESARVLVIAEAPGFAGARFSGIAMTCERTLLGKKPGVPAGEVFPIRTPIARTSSPAAGNNRMRREFGFCESTATTVWGELLRRPGAARQVVLWNAFAFHPHEPCRPLTNRTPHDNEVVGELPVLEAFLRIFPARVVVAVGETSQRRLNAMGVDAIGVRHPSHGGAREFTQGLGRVLNQVGLTLGQGSLLPC